jgi:hypothetical protein
MDVVVIEGVGSKVIVKVAVLVVSATDVAVTTTFVTEVTEAEALYVTPVVVWPDSVPGPLVIAQVTPALFLSLLTDAVSVTVLP